MMKVTGYIILLLTILSCSNHGDKNTSLNSREITATVDLYGFLNYILTDSTDIGLVKDGYKVISDIEVLPPPSFYGPEKFSDYLSKELSEKDTLYIVDQLKERKNFRTDRLQTFGFTIVKVSDLRNKKIEGDEFWNTIHDKYGPGYLTVSRPIFNRDFTKAYVRFGYVCGRLCGGGEDIIMERINGKWTITQHLGGWTS
jgi:hypothetical protein